MNFPTNIDVGFNLENIGVVIGKNISVAFAIVESKLHLKSKMVASQSIVVTNIANFAMEKKPKRAKKEKMKDEKREKVTDDVVMHKNLKGFNEVECRTINKAISKMFDNFFPLELFTVLDVELLIQRFVEAPSRIRCYPLCIKHRNGIKIKFMTQHKTKWKMPMYTCLISLINSKENFPTKPTNWNEISKCVFFVLGE
jgi:hypothetical protein